MTYWLSRAGATQAEGPYTPRQIQTMWSNGQITAEDQLCPTDVEDGWLPAEMVVEELEERAVAREALPSSAKAYAHKKRKAVGSSGCAVLVLGLIMLLFFWPVGVLLIAAAIVIDHLSVKLICTSCGNITVKTARECSTCRAHFQN